MEKPVGEGAHWWVSRVDALAVFGLATLIIAVYFQARGFGFLNWDDVTYVTGNPMVRNGLGWDAFVWAMTTSHFSNWHPLTWLSHQATVEAFGMDPGAHHLVNVGIHLANCWLLYALLLSSTGNRLTALLVAALFAVHPQHVESVSWVSERKGLLSTSFLIASLWAYVAYTRKPGTWQYVVSLALFAFGLMSKPVLVTFPILLFLVDLWPLRRLSLHRDGWRARVDVAGGTGARWILLEKLPFFALALASAVITVLVQQRAMTPFEHLGIAERIGNALIGYVRYLWMTLYPSGMSFFYPLGQSVSWAAAAGSGVLLAVITAVVLRWTPVPMIAGWAWFIVSLFPMSGVVQVGLQSMADRYVYVPHIGLFAGAAWSLRELWTPGSQRLRAAMTAGAAAVVLVLAWVSHADAARWRDKGALSGSALQRDPSNYFAHMTHGHYLLDQGRLEDAQRHLLTALGALEGHWYEGEAHMFLGHVAFRQGDAGRAEFHYARAIELKPFLWPARWGLGNIAISRNDLELAESHYREALKQNPNDAGILSNIGVVLQRQGRVREALETYELGLRREPRSVSTMYNLASLLAQVGDVAGAIRVLDRLLDVDPEMLRARIRRAQLRLDAGDRAGARADVDRVLARDPENRAAMALLPAL